MKSYEDCSKAEYTAVLAKCHEPLSILTDDELNILRTKAKADLDKISEPYYKLSPYMKRMYNGSIAMIERCSDELKRRGIKL